MNKIVIEYQSQNDRLLLKLLMAAVMEVLKRSNVSKVIIRTERNVFVYQGGSSNGL